MTAKGEWSPAVAGALYCSAMVQHCHAAADIGFLPGVHGTNVVPHDIDGSSLPHASHRLIRDLGVSRLRGAVRALR